MRLNATPYIQSRQDGSGGGGGEKSFILTPRDLLWSGDGRTREGNDEGSTLEEKSDRPIVATKPVKAGGAKGAMGFEA